MPYKEVSPYVFDCDVCETRCDGRTVLQFDFERDVRFSEEIESEITNTLNSFDKRILIKKTTIEGYPDLEVYSNEKNEILDKKPDCYIEVKGQARTFMSISKILSSSGLKSSETLALNLSDLERYFTIFDEVQLPVYLVWCLMRRPCITGTDHNSKVYFHQNLKVLRDIRVADEHNSRKYRRASGRGDYVDGQHRGVVVNYHFSINELIPGLPDPAKYL